jgi:hypothetical protein
MIVDSVFTLKIGCAGTIISYLQDGFAIVRSEAVAKRHYRLQQADDFSTAIGSSLQRASISSYWHQFGD